MLSFVINNNSNNVFNVSTAPKNFYLKTEFKPSSKPLFFGDYIDYYSEKQVFCRFDFSYRGETKFFDFSEKDTKLTVSI